ncbi:hypothetical protein [Xylanibacter ruminicola]|uniref:Tetratricopeptide repeat-containing protein n=1 Tax=Xylanibacter ruminicola TaxID=839 RepID=A0A1M6Y5Z6_XYLRU|nr:hypothetical protein [Xylanibacter ruminicola]SHL13740.1 hypothetical protein SAMN05216463_12452 [Xylanibacter ruminicola]
MKKFIVISLLTALSLPSFACAWGEPENPYLFSMYVQNDFKTRVERICNDNWKAYLGSTEAYFWFDADDAIKAARRKGDALMVSYVQNLKKYLDCVAVEQNKQHEWNYPTKKEIATQQRNLQAVRTYALGKTKTRLRSQHALLYMRCNMMLGRHQDNISFWQQTASQYIETVYKDMMKNIYAGALYKTGREAEAGRMFAEMDDYESLMTIYYNKRSFQAISDHYRHAPNSKVLPFLLQDFVNNAQEAEDAKTEGAYGGKLFIRDINQQESRLMQQFCDQVVREGKTATPLMWKCAKAWLEYLAGKKQDALKDIEAAMKLEGTDRMKDNARVLRFYITAATAKPGDKFDNYLAGEITWLKGQADPFFARALQRTVNQALVPHYHDRPNQLLALLSITGNNSFDARQDTMRVDRLEQFYSYARTPASKKFDKYLKSQLSLNDTVMAELIGTKHMRMGQWAKAVEWLNAIPASFYNHHRNCEYRYYSLQRSYTVEPWLRRQWLNSARAYEGSQAWTANLKLRFSQEMLAMEQQLSVLDGLARQQRCYDLAVRYAQASRKGDCWWLTHDSKSCCDSVGANELDFGAKAAALLQQAAAATDAALKTKALFAMGYQELYNATPGARLWKSNEWSDQAADYVTRYNRQSAQFQAFQSLFQLVGDTGREPAYVARCDEYAQFKKYYRRNK